MQTYIALLRGINVSGQKKIKMADLRALLASAGFAQVQTYIQSGNIAFSSAENDQDALARNIETAIQQRYDFHVPTLVLTAEEIAHALTNNPFTDKDTNRLYFTFLAAEPTAERVSLLKEANYAPEEFALHGKVVYFFSPHGYGRAKMNNNFFENKLQVKATTRNWKTVHKLLEMANESYE